MTDKNNQHYLEIYDVYKAYGDKVILDNVDLKVDKGEFCSLVGPSGCGKSTLLRLILGEESPTAGKLVLDGETIGHPDVNRGVIFQRYSLFPHLSVMENVTLGLKLGGRADAKSLSNQQIHDEAMILLEKVRLKKHGDKYPHQLSGGMQQRVAIAQALIMKPKILMMDEPFGALDPDTREDMQLSLLELWEAEKMTIFFITHDMEEAAFLGTRILALSQYYTDDRGVDYENRGSKIAVDRKLPQVASPTNVKHSPEFRDLIEEIRDQAFNPEYLQHAKEFNLSHPNAFVTLTQEEASIKRG